MHRMYGNRKTKGGENSEQLSGSTGVGNSQSWWTKPEKMLCECSQNSGRA